MSSNITIIKYYKLNYYIFLAIVTSTPLSNHIT